MPKVELHVHLEGSVRPETLLRLAARSGLALPASDVAGLREWYAFRDFPHFESIYVTLSQAIRTADDVELIAREFLDGQAEQNVLHSEATFTASTLEARCGIPWADQLGALERAQTYGRERLGVSCLFVLDIVRGEPPRRADEVVTWAIEGRDRGVVAGLGLSGQERFGSGEYREAVTRAIDAGLPFLPHAGETEGPASIREVLALGPVRRLGHGVRAIEEPSLVDELRDKAIPLEVCPTSNGRLGVYPSLEEHPLPRLLDEGLVVTINSDDPPMFGTTISDEYHRAATAFGFDEDIVYSLVQTACRESLLPDRERRALSARIREEFSALVAPDLAGD